MLNYKPNHIEVTNLTKPDLNPTAFEPVQIFGYNLTTLEVLNRELVASWCKDCQTQIRIKPNLGTSIANENSANNLMTNRLI